MTRFFFSIVFFILLPIQSLSLQSSLLHTKARPGGVQLIEAGAFHGDEIQARSGERWLGLYKTAKGFALIDSVVQIKRVHDPVVDEDENKETGKEVSVNHSSEPIFLVKGAMMLKTGSVTTVFVGRKALGSTSNVSLKLGSNEYRLKVTTKERNPEPGIGLDDAKLVLTATGITQVLYSIGGKGEPTEAYWSLLWAGDLDDDGKLDLFVSVGWHYNMSERRLFLSSQAGKGQIVKKVAQFTTLGC
jgi:hypothetical protein